MADDTRLAEACLLLNYSEQSYKEQLSSSKQCLIEASNEHKRPGEQQVAETSSNCPSLMPIKQEQIVEYETLEAVNRYPDQLIGYETSLRSEDESLKEASPHLAQRESCYNVFDTDATQPMNSLLAAVNCALPSLKIRPTILQRSSSLCTPSKSFTNHSNLSDHDYCQSEYGLSTVDFTDTAKQSGIGVESHDLVTNAEAKRQGELRIKNRRKQRQLERLSPSDTLKKPLRFIAIHLGAGNAQNETESIAIAKSICEEIMLRKTASEYSSSRKKKKNCCLSSNGVSTPSKECRGFYLNEDKMDAESAVVQLVKLMEDNQVLNCGFGSNLNIRGQVECDASLMSDRTQLWTGVGAVSGCKNPILLAKSLFDHQIIPRHLGLIQPNILVGSGAKQWMQQHCPYLCIVDSKLVSSKSFETYQKLKSRFDAAVKFYSETSCEERHIDTHARTNPSSNHQGLNLCSTTLDHGFYCSSTRDNLKKVPTFARAIERINDPTDNGNLSEDYGFCGSGRTVIVESDIGLQPTAQDHRLDTVGAIAVDSDNCFASAISSGGLLLKCKGRLGQAAIPGAGCWSEDSVAATTTGVGEYLTLNMFAKRFYDKMSTMRLLYDLGHIEKKSDLSNVFNSAMKECFDDLMRSPALNHVAPQDRLAGMLTVCTLNSKESPKRIDDKDLYLTYAHNTNSMCVAYMTCEDTASNVFMSRKLQDGQNCKTVIKTIKLSPNYHDHLDNFVVHDSLNSTSTSS